MSSRLLAMVVCVGCLVGTNCLVSAEEVSAPASGPRYSMRYKFNPGRQLQYDVATSQEYTSQVGGVADTAWSKSAAQRHFRVKSVEPNGDAVIELVIDRVQMSAQASSTARIEEFDSSDPAKQPPKYKQILDRIGKPQANLHVSNTGKPIKVTNNDGAPVKANQAVSVGPEVSAESFLSQLPEHAVAVGESWKEKFEVGVLNSERLAVKIMMMRVYRLAEVKDGIARITYQTTILSPVHDPSLSAQLIQRETSGAIEFDLNQGDVISCVSSADRTVVNAFGDKSSLRVVTKYVERQMTDGQAGTPRAPRL